MAHSAYDGDRKSAEPSHHHQSHAGDAPHWTMDQMKPIAQHPQVYCKVSGVLQMMGGKVPTDVAPYRASLDQLWELFGPDRVVYGSNWPKSDQMGPYASVLKVVKEYVT